MKLNELNALQLRAEETVYALETAKKHLAHIPGYDGAKAKVVDALNVANYVLREVNKLEVTEW
jgi:hypothetical protein